MFRANRGRPNSAPEADADSRTRQIRAIFSFSHAFRRFLKRQQGSTRSLSGPGDASGLMYQKFKSLDGTHAWRDVAPDGDIDYRARFRAGGGVIYFNFEL